MIKHFEESMKFDNEVKEGKVIVDFFATWCGPCRMLGQVLEEFSKENDEITILKVDIDDYQELAMKFGIMSVPTILFYKDGELINKRVGFCDKKELINYFN